MHLQTYHAHNPNLGLMTILYYTQLCAIVGLQFITSPLSKFWWKHTRSFSLLSGLPCRVFWGLKWPPTLRIKINKTWEYLGVLFISTNRTKLITKYSYAPVLMSYYAHFSFLETFPVYTEHLCTKFLPYPILHSDSFQQNRITLTISKGL